MARMVGQERVKEKNLIRNLKFSILYCSEKVYFHSCFFFAAWKMADLYTRCKKTTVVTPIPLTGTAMFTQRISFCKRFCRRLRSSSFSFCFCCIGNSTVDGMTRQESIEAFHNEIRGLGVEERPEGNVAQKRRGNLISATKSMKLVQKLHNCDKPTQRRVPD